MGMIAELLSFVRTQLDDAHVSEAKIDPGGQATETAQHFAPPGDDSHPLEGDKVVAIEADGKQHAIGYVDEKNEPKAGAGEKRIYSRDGDGALVAEVWLKADGTIIITGDGTVHVGAEEPDDAAARASVVDARLDALEQALNNFVNVFNAHTHVAPMGGTTPPSSPAQTVQPGQSTASSTVKVQS